MAYEVYRGDSKDDPERAAYLMRLFGNARINRVNFENQWEEAAALVLPEYRNSFSFGHSRDQGQKYSQFQVDSTASIAAWRFMNICDAMLTPSSLLWSVVQAVDPALARRDDVRKFMWETTQTLWAHRYRPEANFDSQNKQNYLGLGVFGNMSMMVEEYDAGPAQPNPGLRYIALPVGELYILTNHQGRVDAFVRHFRWNARRAFSRWGEKVEEIFKSQIEANSPAMFDFLQFVLPRTDYDPGNWLDPKGKPWQSVYMSVTGMKIVEESGYRVFPLACGRYVQAPEEDYGRGPAQLVLPEIKTLNAEKSDFLTQGHRSASPPILIHDDQIDFKLHPNSFVYGALDSQGHELAKPFLGGNIQVSKEMMDESRAIINSGFLVDLFPLLFEKGGRQRSAREVIEAANDKGIFLAPTLGRQYSEYLGPLVDRELDVLAWQGLLPEMPQALREAKDHYKTAWNSPLARAARGNVVAGYMRIAQFAQETVQMGGSPEVMDKFDFDVALGEMAQDQFVPPSWMASDEKIAAKRKARQQMQERERQVKEMPGRAAMAKAQAITAKAQTGGNIGGTLSGTPEGGMPEMEPQNPPGQPGVPGVGGRPGQSGRPG